MRGLPVEAMTLIVVKGDACDLLLLYSSIIRRDELSWLMNSNCLNVGQGLIKGILKLNSMDNLNLFPHSVAGLLQIEYENETCYTEPKNGHTIWDQFWTQYNQATIYWDEYYVAPKRWS